MYRSYVLRMFRRMYVRGVISYQTIFEMEGEKRWCSIRLKTHEKGVLVKNIQFSRRQHRFLATFERH